MELTSPRTAKDILAQHGLKPRYGLGQNFLIDKNVIYTNITNINNSLTKSTTKETKMGNTKEIKNIEKRIKKDFKVESLKILLDLDSGQFSDRIYGLREKELQTSFFF